MVIGVRGRGSIHWTLSLSGTSQDEIVAPFTGLCHSEEPVMTKSCLHSLDSVTEWSQSWRNRGSIHWTLSARVSWMMCTLGFRVIARVRPLVLVHLSASQIWVKKCMICTLEFRVIARVSPLVLVHLSASQTWDKMWMISTLGVRVKIGFTHFFTPKSTAPSYMRDGIHWATAPFGNPDQHVLTGAASSTSRVRPLHAACAAHTCTCTRERPAPPLKRRRVGFFSVCRSWVFFCHPQLVFFFGPAVLGQYLR